MRRPAMLTIFAIPKAFEGHSDIIQRNAVPFGLSLSTHANWAAATVARVERAYVGTVCPVTPAEGV